MVNREELSMFVEPRILATLLQPNEHQSYLAYWARELPVNTPAAEYPIRRQVIQGIVVPNIHSKVCLCGSVVCPNPFLPSTEQIINQELHLYTHIILWMSRNYQRQEYILSLEDDAGREIEGDNEHRPTSVRGCRHSIKIEAICCQRNTYITSLLSFLTMNPVEMGP
jgi:hypothetical protein